MPLVSYANSLFACPVVNLQLFGKLEHGMSPFSKSSIFIMVSVRYETKSCAFSNIFDLKRFFEKLRFRGGLMQTVSLTTERKLRFQIILK